MCCCTPRRKKGWAFFLADGKTGVVMGATTSALSPPPPPPPVMPFLPLCLCLPACKPTEKGEEEKDLLPAAPTASLYPHPSFFCSGMYRVGSIYVVVKSSFSVRVCWLVSFRSSEFELHSRDRKERRASSFHSTFRLTAAIRPWCILQD